MTGLKKARIEKGYSKSDLAREINVHYSQIGHYEEKGAQPLANGFQKGVKENGFILLSKRISGTISDFIIMKGEDGLFYAPQIHTPGVPNDMIALPNQENLLSMDEVNFYYQKATRKMRS